MYLNKTILITGANSGLGRNLALNYARQGGRIITPTEKKNETKTE